MTETGSKLKGDIMRWIANGVAILAGVMGLASAEAAGNRGLSPIIPGEELMFTMDVPSVPAQQTPIVLAQAVTPSVGSTTQPDFILKYCSETESSGDSWSAMRVVDPAFMLKNYLERHDKTRTLVIDLASIKTKMLEGTTHGNIFAEVDNKGLTSYHYDPVPAYEGKDRAVFMAEFEGKRYKIVVDLVVSLVVNENDPVCPPPKLIKVNGKPVSSSSGYDLNAISVTFADLVGAAVGQTNATGIILDSNAA